MTDTIKGGCLCGAVRYEASAQPLHMGNCHCRDCQRFTGAAYAPSCLVARESVKITGPVKWHAVTGESGNAVRRGFCAECGSSLFAQPDLVPHIFDIFAGTLDDPGMFRPAMDIYTDSAQPWDHMNPALPKAPRSPNF